jgi:fluoride exporter
MNFLVVFIGGGLGSLLRYLIGIGLHRNMSSLPVATFVANVSACFIFAFVVWMVETRQAFSPAMRLLLLTGFCGGLSTFSTVGYETFLLLRQGMLLYASLNILLSTAICLLMFYLFYKQIS